MKLPLILSYLISMNSLNFMHNEFSMKNADSSITLGPRVKDCHQGRCRFDAIKMKYQDSKQ